MKRQIIIAIGLLFFLTSGFGQNIEGIWKTFDDNTGEARSYVKIWQTADNLYFGQITKILDDAKKDEKCDKCTGQKKDKPIVGLMIIEGMKKDGNEYEAGKILDPEDGKEYDCKIWLDNDGSLKVRGYIGWLYRTQSWEKVDS